jgi:hypothetical protein
LGKTCDEGLLDFLIGLRVFFVAFGVHVFAVVRQGPFPAHVGAENLAYKGLDDGDIIVILPLLLVFIQQASQGVPAVPAVAEEMADDFLTALRSALPDERKKTERVSS